MAGTGTRSALAGSAYTINGRFYSRPVTGVERYGRELTAALRGILAERESCDTLKVALHRTPLAPGPDLPRSAPIGSALPGHCWEQLVLPWIDRSTVLLSLANSGPVIRRRQVVIVHDAAIYDVPGSFGTPYRLWYRALYSVLRRTAAVVGTVSDFSRERLANHWNIPVERIVVIPNGVDHIYRIVPERQVLSRFGLYPRKYVLTLGSQAPHKNVGWLPQALPLLRERGLKLVVAGGANPRVFGSTVTGDAVRGLVRTGRVSDGEVRALMENAFAFVFPSSYEGFGIPPLEALALGVPTAVRSRRPFTDLLTPAAWFLEPENEIVSLGRFLDQLCMDETERSHVGEVGRDLASRYTWRRSAEILMGVLGEMTSPGRDCERAA